MSSIERSRLSAFSLSDIYLPTEPPTAAGAPPDRDTPCLPCGTLGRYRKDIELFEAGMMHDLDKRLNDLPSASAALGEGPEYLGTGGAIERGDGADNVAAINKAVADTMHRLMTVAADRVHTPVAPQIVRKADGGFNLIRRVPPIENLVLTGGGAKGVGMGGALLALADAGQLDNLRTIAGSSAGALVATWLSVGRSLDELNGILTGRLRQLLATDDTLNAVYPDISFRPTARVVAALLAPFGASHDTATGMIRKLDEITAQEAGVFLRTRDADTLRRDVAATVLKGRAEAGKAGSADGEAVRREVDQALARLEVLTEMPDFTRSRAGRMVTFADMALLHALAPEKFRHISMSVHDATTGRNVVFDQHTTPSLPVAYAARASMAHPLIATGVSFPQFTGPAARHVFSDGGISSNVPIGTPAPLSRARSNSDPTGLRSPELQRRQAAATVMVFDNDGETDAIMHAPPADKSGGGFLHRLYRSISFALMGWVASNPHMAEDTAADQQKIHDFGPNVFNVKHNGLSTMDIDASPVLKQETLAAARADARQQIGIVRGDLYAVEVASVAEAFALLDEEEKALLRDKGRTPAPPGSEDRSAAAQQQLLQMARQERGERDLRQAALREAALRDAELDEATGPLFLPA
ncbi:patatin-like phospholipase family protein [Pseudochelatococcus sp. B33]